MGEGLSQIISGSVGFELEEAAVLGTWDDRPTDAPLGSISEALTGGASENDLAEDVFGCAKLWGKGCVSAINRYSGNSCRTTLLSV